MQGIPESYSVRVERFLVDCCPSVGHKELHVVVKYISCSTSLHHFSLVDLGFSIWIPYNTAVLYNWPDWGGMASDLCFSRAIVGVTL